MYAMNNDGLSPFCIDFLAGKLNGAIKHHKKTAAAIRFDGIRKKKTAKFGRQRAALTRQIVQQELLEMSLAAAEQMNDNDARELAIFDSYLDGRGGWLEDRCDICDRFESNCHCYDDHPALDCRDEDYGCPDCGCMRCQCSDFDYGYDPYYEPFFEVSLSEFGELAAEIFGLPRLARNDVSAEDEMKMSDELWLEHEFFYGRNDLRTMTKTFGDEHYGRHHSDDLDFLGYDDIGLYPTDEEPVNEFGGIPNHFDPNFHYHTHFWKGTMYDWDFSVDFTDTDFMFGPDPRKVRRMSRFTETTGSVTYIDQTGFQVTDVKVKRADRFGRTHNHKWLNCRGEDKDIQRTKDKTAEKRAHKRLLDEVLGVDAKKGVKTRFHSMEEKEQYEARQSEQPHSNVDYSLPVRRMKTREVHVTRKATVNGRSVIVSEGFELMQVRY